MKLLFTFLLIVSIAFCSTAQLELTTTLVGLEDDEGFGATMDMSDDGNRLVISSHRYSGIAYRAGQVRVFEFVNNSWQQLGPAINGINESEYFGTATAISGDGNHIIVGSQGGIDNGEIKGRARVYTYAKGDWVQRGETFVGKYHLEGLGSFVDISRNGNVIAINAPGNDDIANNAGQVRIYNWENEAWGQLGQGLNGDYESSAFGARLSLNFDGLEIAIGAHNNSFNQNSGHAVIYRYLNGEWIQKGNLIEGDFPENEMGSNVYMNFSGDRVAVADYLHDNTGGINAGQVKVFNYQNGNWLQIGNEINGTDPSNFLSHGLSLSRFGNRIVVSARENNQRGQVRVFDLKNDLWEQVGDNLIGHEMGELFGAETCLSLDGNRLAVSAPAVPNQLTDPGKVRIYDILPLSTQDPNIPVPISIFPNPNNGQFEFDLDKEATSNFTSINYELFDAIGKRIESGKTLDQNMIIKDLPTGMYILKVKIGRQFYVERLLINH